MCFSLANAVFSDTLAGFIDRQAEYKQGQLMGSHLFSDGNQVVVRICYVNITWPFSSIVWAIYVHTYTYISGQKSPGSMANDHSMLTR